MLPRSCSPSSQGEAQVGTPFQELYEHLPFRTMENHVGVRNTTQGSRQEMHPRYPAHITDAAWATQARKAGR